MTTIETGSHDSHFPRKGARFSSLGLGAAVVVAALAAGCGSAIDSATRSSDGAASGSNAAGGGEESDDREGGDDPGGGAGTGTGTGTGTAGGGATGGGGATDGVPCDVANVLAARCLSCHGQALAGGAPIALVTYAQLTATSPGYAPATQIERSLARMKDAQSPMPPGQPGSVSAADLAVIQAWIDGGTPKGACGAGPGGATPSPFDAPAKCTSGNLQSPEEGGSMAPGRACLSCHDGSGEAPRFYVAGTVYPSAHEPNDCQSTGVSGSFVEITDANQHVTQIQVGASGNFYLGQPIALPYSTKVVFQGRERPMGAQQQSGDCNSCHTQAGASGAPGRVLIP